MPIDTRVRTSASRGGWPGIAPGRGGSGKCANPSGCRYGRCSGTVGAGAVWVAETAETPAGETVDDRPAVTNVSATSVIFVRFFKGLAGFRAIILRPRPDCHRTVTYS
jgi:hypothetical protein